MAALDIRTPKGRRTRADELELKGFIEREYDFRYIETDKDEPARVDAILVRAGVVEAVAEAKCRYDMTVAELRDVRRNEWLITADKVDAGIMVAAALRAPFVGYLYIVRDRVLFAVKITDRQGTPLVRIRRRETTTQATVNGGLARRDNAFIDLSHAKMWQLPPKGDTRPRRRRHRFPEQLDLWGEQA